MLIVVPYDHTRTHHLVSHSQGIFKSMLSPTMKHKYLIEDFVIMNAHTRSRDGSSLNVSPAAECALLVNGSIQREEEDSLVLCHCHVLDGHCIWQKHHVAPQLLKRKSRETRERWQTTTAYFPF